MNCQKCRTPLQLDNSLQDLNPAAFDLLIGSTGHLNDPDTKSTRPAFPEDRKDLYNKVSQDASSPVFKRVIPQARPGSGLQPVMATSTKTGLKENPAMSFVMLTDSQVVPPQPTKTNRRMPKDGKPKSIGSASHDPSDGRDKLSQRIESTTRLFEIVSARSDIDHPICTECTELLLSSYQNRLSSATKERDTYITFLKTLKNNAPTHSEVAKAQSALKKAQEEETRAFTELIAVEKEKDSVDADIARLEAESRALDAEEKAFWQKRNEFVLELTSFQNERDALNAAYDHDNQQLERLQRTNVYNDTFCIGHDGFFGTINGLRLGRLPPPQNVDWTEINAAWGTAALLLNTVAGKLGFTFRGYRIKPMGSMSTIEKVETPSASASNGPNSEPKITTLQLFSSGDLPIGRSMFHRRLDTGMVAFLECLRQLGEFVQTGDVSAVGSSPSSNPQHSPGAKLSSTGKSPAVTESDTALPYPIHRDKINDVSIKLGLNTLAPPSNALASVSKTKPVVVDRMDIITLRDRIRQQRTASGKGYCTTSVGMNAEEPPFGHFAHPDESAANSSITSREPRYQDKTSFMLTAPYVASQYPEEVSSAGLFLPYVAPYGEASATSIQEADLYATDGFDMGDTDLDSLFTDDNIPNPTTTHPPIAPSPISFSNAITPTGYPTITPKPAPFPTMIPPTTTTTTSPHQLSIPHPNINNYNRLTDKERILIKRMQDFVEDYESLKREMLTSKQQAGSKYKSLVYRLDRLVQQHLKNGVPRIAKGKVAVGTGMGGAGLGGV